MRSACYQKQYTILFAKCNDVFAQILPDRRNVVWSLHPPAAFRRILTSPLSLSAFSDMLLVLKAAFSSAESLRYRKCYAQRFGAGKESLMEPERNDLVSLFPGVAAQIRNTLASLHLAADQLVPPSAREQDPALDRASFVKAPLLWPLI